MATVKHFDPTFSSEDARFFCLQKAARLNTHAELGTQVLEDIYRQSDAVATLQRDGVVILPGLVEGDAIRALGNVVDDIVRRQIHLGSPRHHRREIDEKRELGDFVYLPADKLDRYDLTTETTGVSISQPIVNVPGILDIILDDNILSLANAYYQAVPLLTFAKVRQSFVNGIPAADTNLWHADTGSYRILKFLIYLNDVDPGGGPFQYVRGSHNRIFEGWKNEDYKLRYTDEELLAEYGADNIVSCTAKVGDVVVADTTGFHRGLKPESTPRKIIIINFCVHPERGFEYTKIAIRQRDQERLSPMQRAVIDDLEVSH